MSGSTRATPLPPLTSPQFHDSGLYERPNAVAAYEKILKAEAHAALSGSNDDLVSARVAGYFMLELYASRRILGDQAFTSVIEGVMRSSQGGECVQHDDHSVVYEVGKLFRDHLILACASNRLLFCVGRSMITS